MKQNRPHPNLSSPPDRPRPAWPTAAVAARPATLGGGSVGGLVVSLVVGLVVSVVVGAGNAHAAPSPAAGASAAPAASTPAPVRVGVDESAVPGFRHIDSMEARVQGCVTCHGRQGEGTANGYYPRIAGKPAGYLYNQLVAFRDGTRRYPPMNYLVAFLPDAYLREMAEHFSRLRPPFAPKEGGPADATLLQRGQSLVMQGDPSKGIPACAACHGSGLTGMDPGIPGLVGLRSAYIAAQLTRWKVGERHAAEPDCMKRVATRLTDADVTAVSIWLARQDPPRDPSPESANLVRMPYACGSHGAPR